MKTVKLLLILVMAGMLIAGNACKKCANEAPRARVINNGPQKASVQIKTSGGNTVNINNVEPNSASDYSTYAAGEITFTIKVSNVDYVKTLQIGNCYDYDIAIDANNTISSTAIDRNK